MKTNKAVRTKVYPGFILFKFYCNIIDNLIIQYILEVPCTLLAVSYLAFGEVIFSFF